MIDRCLVFTFQAPIDIAPAFSNCSVGAIWKHYNVAALDIFSICLPLWYIHGKQNLTNSIRVNLHCTCLINRGRPATGYEKVIVRKKTEGRGAQLLCCLVHLFCRRVIKMFFLYFVANIVALELI